MPKHRPPSTPRPVLGSHPSCTANTMMNISPTQNDGRLNPRMLPAIIPRASQPLSGRNPAYSPAGIPITMLISTAATASSIVAGSRCRITFIAGSLNTKLRPRSPCSTPNRNDEILLPHNGLSSPSDAIARARSAASASGEIRMSIGLPITFTPTNTMTVIASTTNTAWISRRINQVAT